MDKTKRVSSNESISCLRKYFNSSTVYFSFEIHNSLNFTRFLFTCMTLKCLEYNQLCKNSKIQNGGSGINSKFLIFVNLNKISISSKFVSGISEFCRWILKNAFQVTIFCLHWNYFNSSIITL